MKASYIANGLATRRHGNSKKLSHNALTFEENTNIVTFLHNYAEANAILLPGRIRGYKRDDVFLLSDDVVLLPSCTSKRVRAHTRTNKHTHKNTHCLSLQSVWVEYVVCCKEAGLRSAKYSTFTALWRQLTPQIKVMKPMSDLCWVCQQNSKAIMRAANMPEVQKSEVGNKH